MRVAWSQLEALSLPVKTPDFCFCSSVLSRSDFWPAALTYDCTSSLCSSDVRACSCECSGAMTMYVAPNIVSGLVVKTSRLDPPVGSILISVFEEIQLVAQVCHSESLQWLAFCSWRQVALFNMLSISRDCNPESCKTVCKLSASLF